MKRLTLSLIFIALLALPANAENNVPVATYTLDGVYGWEMSAYGQVSRFPDGIVNGAANLTDGSLVDTINLTGTLTLTGWALWFGNDQAGHIARGNNLDLVWLPNHPPEIAWRVCGTQQVLTSPNIMPAVWWHVAAIADYDTGKAKLYINGELAGECVLDTVPDLTTLTLGSFAGALDEWQVYDYALSDSDIAALFVERQERHWYILPVILR